MRMPTTNTKWMIGLGFFGVAAAFSGCNCEGDLDRTDCNFSVTAGSNGAVDFGEVEVGRENARTVVVENLGNVRLADFEVLFSERNDVHYRTNLDDDFAVSIGTSQTFSVIFAPQAESTNLGSSFTISHPAQGGDACPSYQITLDGEGYARFNLPDAGVGDGGDGDGDGGLGDGGPGDGGDGDGDGGVVLVDAGVVTPPDGGVDIEPTTKWSARGALQKARSHFAAVPLADGTIVAIGGYGENGQATTSIERFDPATGISEEVADMTVARAEPGAARLPSGLVVIVGGLSSAIDGVLVTTVEVFDPDTAQVVCLTGQGDCDLDDIDQGLGLLDLGRLSPLVTAVVPDPNAGTLPDIVSVSLGRTVVAGLSVPAGGGVTIDLTGVNPAVSDIAGADTIVPRVGEARAVWDDGSFVAIGGVDPALNVLTDVVTFDASTQTMATAPVAVAARAFGQAAVRPIDGAVMVAGGQDGAGAAQAAVEELVDVWGTPMVVLHDEVEVDDRRAGSMLALDGDILVLAGGTSRDLLALEPGDSFVPLRSAELLVPFLTSSFLRVGADNDLATGRIFGQQLVLPPDRDVAVYLGGTSTFPRRTAHPAIERFWLNETRFETYGLMGPGSAHVAMANNGQGALLSAGGIDPHTGALSTRVRAYDAETHAYDELPALAQPRRDFSITRLGDNAAYLIAGGRDEAGQVLGSASLYVPLNAAGFDEPLPFALQRPRADHTATALADGRVLLCGGVGTGGEPLDTCEVFVPPPVLQDPGTYDQASFDLVEGRLSAGRVGHTATLLENESVLLVGGGDVEQDLVPADVFDPATDSLETTGQPTVARRDHVAIGLGSNRVLIAGGEVYFGGLAPTATAEVYEGVNGIFLPVEDMDKARTNPAALLLGDGSVLIFGGTELGADNFPTRSIKLAEWYQPGVTGVGTFESIDLPLTYARSDLAGVTVFGRGVAASGTRRDGVLSTGSEQRTPLFFVDRLLNEGE